MLPAYALSSVRKSPNSKTRRGATGGLFRNRRCGVLGSLRSYRNRGRCVNAVDRNGEYVSLFNLGHHTGRAPSAQT
jgi:hypothetical protein